MLYISGDGGNDVSMIQAADAGIGIVGKEGKQASLAADFSITQFSYVGRLLLWHGRNRLVLIMVQGPRSFSGLPNCCSNHTRDIS